MLRGLKVFLLAPRPGIGDPGNNMIMFISVCVIVIVVFVMLLLLLLLLVVVVIIIRAPPSGASVRNM